MLPTHFAVAPSKMGPFLATTIARQNHHWLMAAMEKMLLTPTPRLGHGETRLHDHPSVKRKHHLRCKEEPFQMRFALERSFGCKQKKKNSK